MCLYVQDLGSISSMNGGKEEGREGRRGEERREKKRWREEERENMKTQIRSSNTHLGGLGARGQHGLYIVKYSLKK